MADVPLNQPLLSGFKGGSESSLLHVRALTDDEQEKFKLLTLPAIEARSRFRLFKIVQRNYEAWDDYIKSLLQPGGLGLDQKVELDRLMMNFLSSAKSLIDYFEKFYVHAHRKTPEEKGFEELLTKISDKYWTFAFFQDYRNCVQHCHLPIGNYSKNFTHRSVTLKVEADSDWLVENFRGWKISKLTKDHGQLDLIKMTTEYFRYLHDIVGPFLAKAFFPKLVDAHNFLATLAQEVAQALPEHTMVFCTVVRAEGEELTMNFVEPPSDLFEEIGIKVTVKPQAAPSPVAESENP